MGDRSPEDGLSLQGGEREKAKVRTPGSMADEIWIADDFDVLPADMAGAFEALEPER